MSRIYRKRLTASATALMLTAALCVQSCRSSLTTTTAASEQRRTTTLATESQKDTMILIVRDSTVLKAKTDTVYVERWRLEVRERIHRDTVRIATQDTVIVERMLRQTEQATESDKTSGGRWWIWPVAMMAGIGIYSMFKRQ